MRAPEEIRTVLSSFQIYIIFSPTKTAMFLFQIYVIFNPTTTVVFIPYTYYFNPTNTVVSLFQIYGIFNPMPLCFVAHILYDKAVFSWLGQAINLYQFPLTESKQIE